MSTADSTSQKVKKKKSKRQEQEQNSDMEPETSTLSFKPPPGFQEVKYSSDSREFDWDAFDENPDLELWAIRLPANLKLKYLNNMSFPLPAAGSKSSGPLAQISAGKKQTRYSIAMSSPASGGEELIGASCLLPRASKGGKLQIAPRPITGALVLSEVVTSGQVDALSTEADTGRLPLPTSTRYSYPAHLLRHKFVPTAVPNDGGSAQLRDRDVNAMNIADEETSTPRDPEPSSPRKHKKRKKEDLNEGQVSKKTRVE